MKGSVGLELGSLVRDKQTYSVGTDKGKFCLPFPLSFPFPHSACFFHQFFFCTVHPVICPFSPSKNLVSGYCRLIQDNSLNTLSPKSDQHQFSPKHIHRLSRAKSMRINKMITKKKSLIFYQFLSTNSVPIKHFAYISLQLLLFDICFVAILDQHVSHYGFVSISCQSFQK